MQQQIEYVRAKGPLLYAPKRVLIVGGSTGYGLSTRIALGFGGGAGTINVSLEREAKGDKTASAGWYNTHAFEEAARREGLFAASINADAFAADTKSLVAEQIEREFGAIDALVYSVAAPRRSHPTTGEVHQSVLKPIGRPFKSKTVDPNSGNVYEVELQAASEHEIRETVSVMGGEDWRLWIEYLNSRGLLSSRFVTTAYTYVGPKLTWPVYRDGTIGKAKADLEAAALILREQLKPIGGCAFVSSHQALVTQSSSAIPVVPLYTALLFKVMKDRGVLESAIEQAYRLYQSELPLALGHSESALIRMDDRELDGAVQAEVSSLWERVTTENIWELSDLKGYREEFLRVFGFGLPGVDYSVPVEIGSQ